jgi:hypothetical protein
MSPCCHASIRLVCLPVQVCKIPPFPHPLPCLARTGRGEYLARANANAAHCSVPSRVRCWDSLAVSIVPDTIDPPCYQCAVVLDGIGITPVCPGIRLRDFVDLMPHVLSINFPQLVHTHLLARVVMSCARRARAALAHRSLTHHGLPSACASAVSKLWIA